MRATTAYTPAPVVDPVNPDDFTVEMLPTTQFVEVPPGQQLMPAAESVADAYTSDRPRFADDQVAQVRQTEQVARTTPALSPFAPGPTGMSNAAFATGFDSTPAMTSVGRNDASSLRATPLELARTLATYGATRSA